MQTLASIGENNANDGWEMISFDFTGTEIYRFPLIDLGLTRMIGLFTAFAVRF